jgi:hypothetical protein
MSTSSSFARVCDQFRGVVRALLVELDVVS